MHPQYHVELHQVVSDFDRLAELLLEVQKWLGDSTPFSGEISVEKSESLFITLGPSQELISSPEKPVFRLDYRSEPVFRTSWGYVVDHSCINIMKEELHNIVYG